MKPLIEIAEAILVPNREYSVGEILKLLQHLGYNKRASENIFTAMVDSDLLHGYQRGYELKNEQLKRRLQDIEDSFAIQLTLF